jgi:hypothetical protein
MNPSHNSKQPVYGESLMARRDEKLAGSILQLAENLLAYHFSLDIIERQFFFRFWCKNYLKNVNVLKGMLSSEDESADDLIRESLYGKGYEWLSQQRPRAAIILRKLSKKYGIAWQDVLAQVIGNLPFAGYPKVEYYLPSGETLRSVPLPPNSLAIVIHNPSSEDVHEIGAGLQKLLPRRKRKPNIKDYVRRCACVCLAARAGYGNREAIKEWNCRFPHLAYSMEPGAKETQPGEIQFSREKHQLLERFNMLEFGHVYFLTDLT